MGINRGTFELDELVKLPDTYLDRYLACNAAENYSDRLTFIYALGLQTIKNGRSPEWVEENIDIVGEICKNTKDKTVLSVATQSLNNLKSP